mmetsp:Transcript_5415/g.5930  ORF Transcript_5415/g.5930 Transcript_5415/m.5930 type:complete len:102 (+) Transcript_5415:326-631(+)
MRQSLTVEKQVDFHQRRVPSRLDDLLLEAAYPLLHVLPQIRQFRATYGGDLDGSEAALVWNRSFTVLLSFMLCFGFHDKDYTGNTTQRGEVSDPSGWSHLA